MKKVEGLNHHLIFAAAVLSLAGCTSGAGLENRPAPNSSIGVSSSNETLVVHPFAQTDWVLIEYLPSGSGDGLVEAPMSAYTLQFGADGSLRLKLDCNRGNGTWEADGNYNAGSIAFGPIASTRASCGPEDIGPQLIQTLGDASTYTVYDNRMSIEVGLDGETLVWDRID